MANKKQGRGFFKRDFLGGFVEEQTVEEHVAKTQMCKLLMSKHAHHNNLLSFNIEHLFNIIGEKQTLPQKSQNLREHQRRRQLDFPFNFVSHSLTSVSGLPSLVTFLTSASGLLSPFIFLFNSLTSLSGLPSPLILQHL